MSSATSSTGFSDEACFSECGNSANVWFRCPACPGPSGPENRTRETRYVLCRRCAQNWRCPYCERHARSDDLQTLSDARLTHSGITVSMGVGSNGSQVTDDAMDACAIDVRPQSEMQSEPSTAARALDIKRLLLFVAVPQVVKDDVLREGFKTRRRNTVPVAAQEEQALEAFSRFHRAPGAILAITSLVDGGGMPYPIVTTRSGLFRICSPGLPSRCIADTSSVFYVAVPQDLRDTILQEGYRPTRRRSVPAANSREAAIRAYRRNFRAAPYEVLAALPPADMPRHFHNGGWKLRARLFPGELLRQLM